MEVLQARDYRVEIIERLLKQDLVVISLRVNYPGLVKDQEVTRFIANEMNQLLRQTLDVVDDEYLNQGEGPIYIYLIRSTDAISIKRNMIQIENHHPLGRLVDLDVYFKDIKSMSRSMLNEPRRSCFLCQQDAFYCIRNKSHTTLELTQFIDEVVLKYGKSIS